MRIPTQLKFRKDIFGNSVMPLEHIRLSQKAKDNLAQLKKRTGLQHWNELCRWGLCVSLAESTPPSIAHVPSDSSLEMTGRIFGGKNYDIYLALLKQRCIHDGLDTSPETLSYQLKLHIHRGINYLVSNKNLRGIASLLELVHELR